MPVAREVALRLAFTAASLVAIVSLLRAGNPFGGLVIAPLAAVWVRRAAEDRGLIRGSRPRQ